MNTFARRLSGVLLTLVLLVLPSTVAYGAPLSGSLERWSTSVTDLLADLLDGLTSIGAASESSEEGETIQPDDGAVETTPTAIPTAMDDNELTTTRNVPGWDPIGMR